MHASVLGDSGEWGQWCLSDRLLGSLDNPFIRALCFKQAFPVILT